MSLDEKFVPVRTAFYEIVENLFKKTAGLFGYPKNQGMPTISDLVNETSARSRFLESLPLHRTPPTERPQTWFEVIVGSIPKIDSVDRIPYESALEGYYNFYIPNYKNIYFLPDWLSEFLQIRFHICTDLAVLETIREVLFVGLMVYSQIVILRIALSWFIYINPYTFPWCYLVAAVDWTEDVLQGIVPAILGVNITGTVFLGILGSMADSLNHLVFTMPFLPSEGEAVKVLINKESTDVLQFHYFPYLWSRHPIPSELREAWYNERRDILDYMQEKYGNLGIRFEPDHIVEERKERIVKEWFHQLQQQKVEDKDSNVESMPSTDSLTDKIIDS